MLQGYCLGFRGLGFRLLHGCYSEFPFGCFREFGVVVETGTVSVESPVYSMLQYTLPPWLHKPALT